MYGPLMATYANGIPSWVDLGSPDPDASAAFYRGLFGWTTTEPGPVEETGGYRMFLKGDKVVAGLGPNQGGAPPSWTTYLAVDDADKTAELVKGNGGMVFVEPMDVMDAGRMAIFADPTGAAFGVWQAGEHTGADIKGEEGSLIWNELMTRDVDGAKRFYSTAFGVEPTPFPQAEGPEYTVLNVNGQGVAGILSMPDDMPAEMPSVWVTYFATTDTDATVANATSLGASVMTEPFDVPTVGRIAVLTGPHGENFAVMKPDPQMQP
jgi:predicted enzyme related to lactoylglutathione lyase